MAVGVLLTPPIIAFTDNSGEPAVNGSVLTQVGGGNAATYQDVGLTSPLPNPIPLNSRGEISLNGGASTQCFLTPNQTYTFTLFDGNGNQLWVATYVNGVQVSQTAAVIGGALWPYNATFDGAPVVNTGYTYGDPRRFGAALDGATDDTAALNSWASGGGNLTFPAQTSLISGEITIPANTTIQGTQGAKIVQSVANLSIFHPVSVSNVKIYQIHFKQTTWGGSAYVGHVFFEGCLHSEVQDCEFEGVQWAGVYLKGAQSCVVKNNYFHDSFPQQSITFSAAPNSGATSGTLTANWTLPTGGYTVQFIETSGGASEGRFVTLTNGAASASWSSGLGANCNAAVTVQAATESSDVVINPTPSSGANYNVIDGNFCYSNTLACGISVEDPYNGVLPTRNIVTNNRITDHLEYGILCYMPDTGDSYNQIIGNFIENISGAFALNNSSGAGIYLTGAGLGGTVVAGNTIRNCCISTAAASLAPAAIGVAGGGSSGGVPISITGNTISDMTQYHGILLTGLGCTGAVSGNAIRMPASNTTGHGITITNCVGIAVTGNTVYILNTTTANRGILVQSLQNIACTDIAVTGNNVRGGHYAYIEITASGGAVVTGFTITGNTMGGGDANCVGIQLGGAVQDGLVTGNYITVPTNFAVNQSGALNIRYANNRLKGAGTVLNLTNTNTGTYFDKTNTGVVDAGVNNAGTGAIIEIFSTGAPSAGTYAVGDTLFNSAPTAGGVSFWRITVAGSPGTIKTISNT